MCLQVGLGSGGRSGAGPWGHGSHTGFMAADLTAQRRCLSPLPRAHTRRRPSPAVLLVAAVWVLGGYINTMSNMMAPRLVPPQVRPRPGLPCICRRSHAGTHAYPCWPHCERCT